MQSLYSNEVREYINTRDLPKNLNWLVEEHTEPLPYLQFVIFRDNFNTFQTQEQLRVANLLNEMFLSLRKNGVPIFLEMRAHA